MWRELVEERTNKEMEKTEKQKRNVKIGGRILSGGHCHLQWNVPHELWNILGNIDRYQACDAKTADKKTIITIIHVVKREKLLSTAMKNLNKLKMNDSWR